MKKEWSIPTLETLSFKQTADNVVVSDESDGIYADTLPGGGNPAGFKCTKSCS